MRNDLQQHFEELMAAPINKRIIVIASKNLKMQLKMLLAISKVFEKVDIRELLEMYEKRGGSKKDIEEFLKR